MGYYRDYSLITLDEYGDSLKTADLVPSRRILQEKTDIRFARIKSQNLNNLAELQKALKTKKKLQEFASVSGIDEDYLIILIREVNSMQPKASRLSEFPEIDEKSVLTLVERGIKNTQHLYDHILTAEQRIQFSVDHNLPLRDVETMASLCDLCRIRWVNSTLASMLLQLSYPTARSVAEASIGKLYEEVNRINKEKGYYRHSIGKHDIKLCIESAALLTVELEI